MSKLEKALEKARAERKNQLTVVSNVVDEEIATATTESSENSNTRRSTDLELRESKTQIGRAHV